jgi:hypothetical protein
MVAMLDVRIDRERDDFDQLEVSGSVADLDGLAEAARKAGHGQRMAVTHAAGELVLLPGASALSLKCLTGSELLSGNSEAFAGLEKAAEACAVMAASVDAKGPALHRHLALFDPAGDRVTGELVLYARPSEP